MIMVGINEWLKGFEGLLVTHMIPCNVLLSTVYCVRRLVFGKHARG
jgi:hypothetical protein